MPDQADILRHLVADALRGQAAFTSPAPPMIAVAGAKVGVGATSVAIALAKSLARQGQRVVLVDVAPQSADMAAYCGISQRYSTADVLAGRREIHEVLQSAPGGLQIAAGTRATPDDVEGSSAQQRRLIDQLRRLIDQLRRLGNHADVIVLDVGCAPTEATLHYWSAAELVLLLTTPDAVSVMDAYAAIKIATTQEVSTNIELLVNQTERAGQGQSVYQRVAHSCQRFLGTSVDLAGEAPFDPHFALSARQQSMLALSAETSPAVQAVELLVGERNFAALAAA